MIKIIAILIAARDSEDARAHHVGSTVHQPRRITPLGEQAGQLLSQARPSYLRWLETGTAESYRRSWRVWRSGAHAGVVSATES
jgi:hypothetical protein